MIDDIQAQDMATEKENLINANQTLNSLEYNQQKQQKERVKQSKQDENKTLELSALEQMDKTRQALETANAEADLKREQNAEMIMLDSEFSKAKAIQNYNKAEDDRARKQLFEANSPYNIDTDPGERFTKNLFEATQNDSNLANALNNTIPLTTQEALAKNDMNIDHLKEMSLLKARLSNKHIAEAYNRNRKLLEQFNNDMKEVNAAVTTSVNESLLNAYALGENWAAQDMYDATIGVREYSFLNPLDWAHGALQILPFIGSVADGLLSLGNIDTDFARDINKLLGMNQTVHKIGAELDGYSISERFINLAYIQSFIAENFLVGGGLGLLAKGGFKLGALGLAGLSKTAVFNSVKASAKEALDNQIKSLAVRVAANPSDELMIALNNAKNLSKRLDDISPTAALSADEMSVLSSSLGNTFGKQMKALQQGNKVSAGDRLRNALSNTWTNSSFLEKMGGIGAAAYIISNVGEISEGRATTLQDWITGTMIAMTDMVGGYASVVKPVSGAPGMMNAIRNRLASTPLENGGIKAKLADVIIEGAAVEGLGESLQTFLELRAKSNYTLPGLDQLLLSSDYIYGKEKDEIIEAGIGGLLGAAGTSAIGGTVGIKNKVFDNGISVNRSRKNKEQNVADTVISDTYYKEYEKKSTLKNSVQSLKDIDSKISKTKITKDDGSTENLKVRVSNETNKALVEKEINKVDKKIEKQKSDLAKAKKDPNAKTDVIKKQEQELEQAKARKKELVNTLKDLDARDEIAQSIRSADILDTAINDDVVSLKDGVSKESVQSKIEAVANAKTKEERSQAIDELLKDIEMSAEVKKAFKDDVANFNDNKSKSSKPKKKATKEVKGNAPINEEEVQAQRDYEELASQEQAKNRNAQINTSNTQNNNNQQQTNTNTASTQQQQPEVSQNESNNKTSHQELESDVNKQPKIDDNIDNASSEVKLQYIAKVLAKSNKSAKELDSLYEAVSLDTSDVNFSINDSITSEDYLAKVDKFYTPKQTVSILKRDYAEVNEDGDIKRIFIGKDGKIANIIGNSTRNIRNALNVKISNRITNIVNSIKLYQKNPTAENIKKAQQLIKNLESEINGILKDIDNDLQILQFIKSTNLNTQLADNIDSFCKSVEKELSNIVDEAQAISNFAETFTAKSSFTPEDSTAHNKKIAELGNIVSRTFSSVSNTLANGHRSYEASLTKTDSLSKNKAKAIFEKTIQLFGQFKNFFKKIADIFDATKNEQLIAVFYRLQEIESISNKTISFDMFNDVKYDSSRLSLIFDRMHSLFNNELHFTNFKASNILINSLIAQPLRDNKNFVEMSVIANALSKVNVELPYNGENISLSDILNLPPDVLYKLFTESEIKHILADKNVPEYKGQEDYFIKYPNAYDIAYPAFREQLSRKLFINGKYSDPKLLEAISDAIDSSPNTIEMVESLTKAGLLVKMKRYISSTSSVDSIDDRYMKFDMALNEEQELGNFSNILGLPHDISYDDKVELYRVANFLSNQYMLSLNKQSSNSKKMPIFQIDNRQPDIDESNDDSSKQKRTQLVELVSKEFLTNISSLYREDLNLLMNELSDSTLDFIFEADKSPKYLSNTKKLLKGQAIAVRKLEAVRHKVESSDIADFLEKSFGISKDTLQTVTDRIAEEDGLSVTQFSRIKDTFMNSNGKESIMAINDGLNPNNPFMYLPITIYQKSDITGSYVKTTRYYYMPELFNNSSKFMSFMNKDITDSFGSVLESDYGYFYSRASNFAELIYFYGNQQFNNGHQRYSKFDCGKDLNKEFRLKYKLQPSTRIFTPSMLGNMISNKLLREVIKSKVVDTRTGNPIMPRIFRHKNVDSLKKDRSLYNGIFYSFIQIFGKDVDKLTLQNKVATHAKVEEVFNDLEQQKITENQAAQILEELFEENLNYVVEHNGQDINLKVLFNEILDKKPEAINLYKEMTKDENIFNVNPFNDHPYMAYSNKRIFDNFIDNNTDNAIVELNDMELKVYIDGASTAIFENMVRLESLYTMRQFARVYNLKDMQTAKGRLSRLLPNEVKEVSRIYASLMNKLDYHGKEMYSQTLEKKGFDPYVFGMALFQFEMSKFGVSGDNIFASLINQFNMIDRDGIKKLILPYLYGSKLDSVLTKALVLNIPNHNKALYGLLKDFTKSAIYQNTQSDNGVNNENRLKLGFKEYIFNVAFRDLMSKTKEEINISDVRVLLNNTTLYSEKAKDVINAYLDALEPLLAQNKLSIKFVDNFSQPEKVKDQNALGVSYDGKNIEIKNSLKTNPKELLITLLHEINHSLVYRIKPTDIDNIQNNIFTPFTNALKNITDLELNTTDSQLLNIRKNFDADFIKSNFDSIINGIPSKLKTDKVNKLIGDVRQKIETIQNPPTLTDIKSLESALEDLSYSLNKNNIANINDIPGIIEIFASNKDESEKRNDIDKWLEHNKDFLKDTNYLEATDLFDIVGASNISMYEASSLLPYLRTRLDSLRKNNESLYKNKLKNLVSSDIYEYHSNPIEQIAFALTEPSAINKMVSDDATYNQILNALSALNMNDVNSPKYKRNYQSTPKESIATIYYNWLKNDIENKRLNSLLKDVFKVSIDGKDVSIDTDKLDSNIGFWGNDLYSDNDNTATKVPDGIFKDDAQNIIDYVQYFNITNKSNEKLLGNKEYLFDCQKVINSFYDEDGYFDLNLFLAFKDLINYKNDIIAAANDNNSKDHIDKIKKAIPNISDNTLMSVINVYKKYGEFLPEHNPMKNTMVTPDLLVTRESSDKAFSMKNDTGKVIILTLMTKTEKQIKETFQRLRPNIPINEENITNALNNPFFRKELEKDITTMRKQYYSSLIDATIDHQKQRVQASLFLRKKSAKDKIGYKEQTDRLFEQYKAYYKNTFLKALDSHSQNSIESVVIPLSQKARNKTVTYILTKNLIRRDIEILPDTLGLFNHNLEAAVMQEIISDVPMFFQIYDGMVLPASSAFNAKEKWNDSFSSLHEAELDIPSLLMKIINVTEQQLGDDNKDNIAKSAKISFYITAIQYLTQISAKTGVITDNIATKDIYSRSNSKQQPKEMSFVKKSLINALKSLYALNGNKWPSNRNINIMNNVDINIKDAFQDLVKQKTDKAPTIEEFADYLINTYGEKLINEIQTTSDNYLKTQYQEKGLSHIDQYIKDELSKINSEYTDNPFVVRSTNDMEIFQENTSSWFFNIKINRDHLPDNIRIYQGETIGDMCHRYELDQAYLALKKNISSAEAVIPDETIINAIRQTKNLKDIVIETNDGRLFSLSSKDITNIYANKYKFIESIFNLHNSSDNGLFDLQSFKNAQSHYQKMYNYALRIGKKARFSIQQKDGKNALDVFKDSMRFNFLITTDFYNSLIQQFMITDKTQPNYFSTNLFMAESQAEQLLETNTPVEEKVDQSTTETNIQSINVDIAKHNLKAKDKWEWHGDIMSPTSTRKPYQVQEASGEAISYTIAKNKSEMPSKLYYAGDISLLDSNHKRLAIIGSRDITNDIADRIKQYVTDKVPNDVVVISGLASGADITAMEAAVDSGKKVIAVLPCPINTTDSFMSKNAIRVLDKIIANGGLAITEYNTGETWTGFKKGKPQTARAVQRDRLQALYATTGVLLTASDSGIGKDSGSRHAMNKAIQYGIPTFVFAPENSSLYNMNRQYGNNGKTKVIKGNESGNTSVEEAEAIIQKSKEISTEDFKQDLQNRMEEELNDSSLTEEEKSAVRQSYEALLDIFDNAGDVTIYESNERNSQKGLTVTDNANQSTSIVLFKNQNRETALHEYIHSLLSYAFNAVGNEVNNLKHKMFKIMQQVKQELDENPNLREELGLTEEDYNYIFNNPEGIDTSLHEFVATFLSRPKLAAYLDSRGYSPSRNRFKNLKGNTAIGTAINALRALIGLAYDLITFSMIRNRGSLQHHLLNTARKISEYNTAEGIARKQYEYQNSKLVKANNAVKTVFHYATHNIFKSLDRYVADKKYSKADVESIKKDVLNTTAKIRSSIVPYLEARDNTDSTAKKTLYTAIAMMKAVWHSKSIFANPIQRNIVLDVLNDLRQQMVEGTWLDFQINLDLGIVIDKGVAKMKEGVDKILSVNTAFAVEAENSASTIKAEIKNLIYNPSFAALYNELERQKAEFIENGGTKEQFETAYETALTRIIYGVKLDDYFYGNDGVIDSKELSALVNALLDNNTENKKWVTKNITHNVNYIMETIKQHNVLTKEMEDKFRAFLFNQSRDLSYTRLTRIHNVIGLQNSEDIFNLLNEMYKSQTGSELVLGKDKESDNEAFKQIMTRMHKLTTLQTIYSFNNVSSESLNYVKDSASMIQDMYSDNNKELKQNVHNMLSLLVQIRRNSEMRNSKRRVLDENVVRAYYIGGEDISDRVLLDNKSKAVVISKKDKDYNNNRLTLERNGYDLVEETDNEVTFAIPGAYKEVSSFDRDSRTPYYMEGYIPYNHNQDNIDVVKLDVKSDTFDDDMKYYADKGYEIGYQDDNFVWLKYKGMISYKSSRNRVGFIFEDREVAGEAKHLFGDFDASSKQQINATAVEYYKNLYDEIPSEIGKGINPKSKVAKTKRLAGSLSKTRENVSVRHYEELMEPDTKISSLFYRQEHNIFNNQTRDFINNQIFYQILLSQDTLKKRTKGKFGEHHHTIKLFDIKQVPMVNKKTNEQYMAYRIIPNNKLIEDYGISFNHDDLANLYKLLKSTNYEFGKKGNEAIYVDTRMFPMLFGFNNLTMNDVSKNGKIQKSVSATASILRGLVKETRKNVIIRNPSLVWENFKSNIVGLIGEGVPQADIWNSIPVIIEQLKQYQALTKEKVTLETRLAALAKDSPKFIEESKKLKADIDKIKRELKNHSLNAVIENGFYTNIVQDSEVSDFKWDKKALDFVQEKTGMSDDLKAYLKEFAIVEDSDVYNILADFTRLGDFVPRVIYYNHLKAKLGMSDKEAIAKARDKFVNYNTPLWSPVLRNVDRFGFTNYMKYAIAIQKQSLEAFAKSPIQASLVVGSAMIAKLSGVSPSLIPSNYIMESLLLDGNLPKGFLSGHITNFVGNLNRFKHITPNLI